MLALPDLTLLTFPTSCPWECVYNMPPRRILDFLFPIVSSKSSQSRVVLSSASHFIVQFGINFIPAQASPGHTMLGYIYDRSKNNQETLFCVVSAGRIHLYIITTKIIQ